MTRQYPPGWYPTLLNAKDGLRLGPMVLEAVVVALRRGKDVHDHVAEVDQHPVRGWQALLADWPDTILTHPPDDPVGDRLELALRSAGADDERVGQCREAVEVEQQDVGRLLVLGQANDPAGHVEPPWGRGPARRPG